jgi:hypothetical protein
MAILAPFFVFLALVKGTSEPLLSNTWLIYSPSESSGILWMDKYLPRVKFEYGRRTPVVWAGPDFRLGQLWLNNFWGPNLDLIPVTTKRDLGFTYLFISPGIRLLSERYHQTIPDLRSADVIYDNGDVRIYYNPPGVR